MSAHDPSESDPVRIQMPSVLPCSKCGSASAKAVHMSSGVWPDVQYYRCTTCAHLWSIRLARTVTP
jgi:DNA-directed RNA polymerase subunit M/transcription elongation factor TFIIS